MMLMPVAKECIAGGGGKPLDPLPSGNEQRDALAAAGLCKAGLRHRLGIVRRAF